jgi:predicted nucleotidyltransferase
MREGLEELAVAEPRLAALVTSCKSDLQATEVWLFGSRARGEARPGSDWDILAVIPDDAPPSVDKTSNIWKVKRRSGVCADLLTVRMSDFIEARDTVNTLSHAVVREGVRLDV